MRTSVLLTVLAVALVLGTACKGPDSTDTNFYDYQVVARAANVLPTPADTTPTATAALTGGPTAISVAYTSALTIDSIFLYQMGAGALNYSVNASGATTYVAPSARVCGGSVGTLQTGLAASAPPACAASTALVAQPTTVNANPPNGVTTTNTATSITNSLRGYGTQMVFFSGTGAFYKRGTIRGTPFTLPGE